MRGHEADLFQAYWLIIPVIFVSYWIYLWCDGVQAFSLASVRGSRLLYDEFLLERLRSILLECKNVCWINYFIYAIFSCSDLVLLLILFRPIAAQQLAAINSLFHFYSFPVALGQINFVLVLISTNHNARYPYPKMDISRAGKEIWKQVDPRKLGYDVSVRPSDPPYRLWVGGMRQESSLRGKEFVPTSTFLPDP